MTFPRYNLGKYLSWGGVDNESLEYYSESDISLYRLNSSRILVNSL